MVSTTNSERTPLLGSTDAGTQHIGDTLSRVTRPISPAKRVLILGLTFSLLIALAIGGTLFDTPITEIQEDIICHRIHGPNLEPGVCKEKEVQSELSFIRGWDTTFTMLPSLIVSVPYGAIADRYGRTLVLGLSLLGITLNAAFGTLVYAMPGIFPPRAIWLSRLFQLVGGGETVFNAMTYSIVADISSEAHRAISFFYIGASLMGGALMANPIVYLAMKRGPWFSIEAGLICLSIATVIAFLIPETLDRTPASKASLHSHQTNSPPQSTDTGLNTGCIPTAGPNNIPTSINNSTSPQREPTDNPQGPVATGLSSITVTLLHTLSSIRFLFWDHKLVGLLLISLALEILGRSAILLLLQYAAKRYGMSYSEAGLLDSVTALTSLVLLLVILPGTSQILLSGLRLSPCERDLRLAQASAIVASGGVMLLGFAGTKAVLVVGVVLTGLGGGYTFMIRGLMSSLVGGHEIGLMYTSIAFVETLSALVSGPVWAGLFNVGMEWGNAWVGLPFIVGGWVLLAAAGLVSVIKSSMITSEGKGDDRLNGDREDGIDD